MQFVITNYRRILIISVFSEFVTTDSITRNNDYFKFNSKNSLNDFFKYVITI